MTETHTNAAESVLLVEDDLAVIDATCMMLEACGYDVRCAADGVEALEHVRGGFCPGLVIADYRLPGDDGIEVVRQVRTAAALQVPAIIITGDTSSRDGLATQLRGVHILRKPVEVDHFIALIEGCMAAGGNASGAD